MGNIFRPDQIIKFTAPEEYKDSIPEPQPAAKVIPDWYKKADLYAYKEAKGCPIHTVHGKQFTNFSFKNCAPFLDSLSMGYIIPLFCDIVVETIEEENDVTFRWNSNWTPMGFHDYHQTKELPMGDEFIGSKAFKFNNPWYIETPPGYSTLIIPPMNTFDERFEIFPAVVDTDQWHGQVTFPFRWKQMPYKGILKEGTPLAQVIPFKRDEFSSEISYTVPEKYKSKLNQLLNKVERGYKNLWWSKKKYK